MGLFGLIITDWRPTEQGTRLLKPGSMAVGSFGDGAAGDIQLKKPGSRNMQYVLHEYTRNRKKFIKAQPRSVI
jgi:hypothetical protein